ncbi:hypothetical protein PoMZ_07808 [Pyricularia oryzae]|nr:hypothetical protein PoMZ_07808 [Pyricularia oryzae]
MVPTIKEIQGNTRFAVCRFLPRSVGRWIQPGA